MAELTRNTKEELFRLSIENSIYRALKNMDIGFDSYDYGYNNVLADKLSIEIMKGDDMNDLLNYYFSHSSSTVCKPGIGINSNSNENKKQN